jgi:hypothetical protein
LNPSRKGLSKKQIVFFFLEEGETRRNNPCSWCPEFLRLSYFSLFDLKGKKKKSPAGQQAIKFGHAKETVKSCHASATVGCQIGGRFLKLIFYFLITNPQLFYRLDLDWVKKKENRVKKLASTTFFPGQTTPASCGGD